MTNQALSQFQTAVPHVPGADSAAMWQLIRERLRARVHVAPQVLDGSLLETGVSLIAVLNDAPPRTAHSTAIARASPMSSTVRAMLERRDFGRRYDADELDLFADRVVVTGLECVPDKVQFLANDRSFEDLSLSVDALLLTAKS